MPHCLLTELTLSNLLLCTARKLTERMLLYFFSKQYKYNTNMAVCKYIKTNNNKKNQENKKEKSHSVETEGVPPINLTKVVLF